MGAVSGSGDLAAWLRAQVEARLALAREASPKTDGHWWRRWTDAGHYDDGTLEQVGPLWSGEPVYDADGDVFGGEYIVVYDEGAPSGAQFDHIALNDPQDTIARCEAELAILDEHKPELIDYRDGDGIERASRECIACEPPGTPDNYPCRTIRLVGSGYRFRPGYREEWAP